MSDDTALAVEVLARMTAQDATLKEIHTQTMRTNGRVTGLEMREAAREAVRIDRAEQLKATAADKAVSLKATAADKAIVVQKKSDKANRKIMVFAAVSGLFSSTVGFVLGQVVHHLF